MRTTADETPSAVLEPTTAARGVASSRTVLSDFDFRAQAVIVASGGFSANVEMRQEYDEIWGNLTEAVPTTNAPTITGAASNPPTTAPITAPTAVPMGPATEPTAAPVAPPAAAPTPVPTGCAPGAPVAKLENEKPQGETVSYDELIKSWQ